MEIVSFEQMLDRKALTSFLYMRKMILLKTAEILRHNMSMSTGAFHKDPEKFLLTMPELQKNIKRLETELLAIEKVIAEVPILHEAS